MLDKGGAGGGYLDLLPELATGYQYIWNNNCMLDTITLVIEHL